jgi:hypothetical protein
MNDKKTLIANFLSTLDLEIPENLHQLNAISDSISYNWDNDILKEISSGITKAYSNKKAK